MAILKYRKIGGGTLHLRSGKIVKPNEVFTADENDIPQAFANTLQVLGPAGFARGPKKEAPKVDKKSGPEKETKPEEGEKEPEAEPSQYLLVPREDAAGWFDVTDTQGKVVNEKALREEEANEMIKALE